VREGIAGPLSSPRQRIFGFLSLRRMSGLQQFIFKTHLHLAFALMSLDTISKCRRCRSVGCLAMIDP